MSRRGCISEPISVGLQVMPFRFSCSSILLMAVTLTLMPRRALGLEPTTAVGRLARQSWSMESGLPQNTVPVVLQSRSGYLWIGTELGLARFDGNAFESIDHARIKAFQDAEIRCLLDAKVDGKGETLWVGTSDGLVRWSDGAARLFTASDGLPSGSIHGLVQASDGTIWIWTDLGLAHWSHNRMEAQAGIVSLVGGITSMAARLSGELWVGGSNGLAVLRDGNWQRPFEVAGSSVGRTLVAEALGDRVLVATSEGVYLRGSNGVSGVIPKAAMPQGDISFLKQLSNGQVAAASKGVLVVGPGTALPMHSADHKESGGSALQGGQQKQGGAQHLAVGKELPGTRIETMYADREGCLWIGTNHGLARIRQLNASLAIEVLPLTDPLAVDGIVSLLEDREGDLWVGTETTGLHILRDARFRMVGVSDGLSSDATTAVVQAVDGAIWIGTRDSGLTHLPLATETHSGNVSSVKKTFNPADGLLSNVILALATAPNGDVWVGTPDGLNLISGSTSKISSYTSADGLADDFIRSLLVEPDSSVWIGTRRGLTHLDHGRFQNYTHAEGLGNDLVGALARTNDGDLWIGTLNGLSRLHQGRLRNYTIADGLSNNIITALEATNDGRIWIGTQGGGLNVWDGKTERLSQIFDHPVSGAGSDTGHESRTNVIPIVIHALLHDDTGHLWLASDFGLTRAEMTGLAQCATATRCDLTEAHVVSFSTADGLRSRETSSNSHPTAVRLRDGQLWFTTPRGVAVVDPHHFASLPDTVPVVIERFSADDQPVAAGSVSAVKRISAGHLRFQFDYAGLSFAAPQKLRYQYMLEGFDHSWTNAGARKTAYYTNIPPGPYRFLVRAAFSESGLSALSYATSGPSYTASQAELSFQLLPHFYQTAWFRILIFLLVVAVVFLIFRRRVLRVEREFSAVFAERNRIAREIHDTLAQGYVGISLQLEIVGELLRHNRTEAATKHVAATQELIREGLDDARQSIWALRSQDSREHTLPVSLRRLVEKTQDSTLTATLEIHGAYRPLGGEAEKEVLRIAQEAIQNVTRHAAATSLHVRLDYDERAVFLSLTDNGKGFLTAVEKPGSKGQNSVVRSAANENGSRHYGLIGMQERAAIIHAEIEITSEPGLGTQVKLRMPTHDGAIHGPSRSKDPANSRDGT